MIPTKAKSTDAKSTDAKSTDAKSTDAKSTDANTMKYQWTDNKMYAECCTEKFVLKECVAFFDLDETLIKTFSRKKHTDWHWKYPIVPDRLMAINNDFSIIIITNQKHLNKNISYYDLWKRKITDIFDKLIEWGQQRGVLIQLKLWAAFGDSVYRKPMSGFFEGIILPELEKSGKMLNYSRTFFCGDAAGRPAIAERKKDFSDTDYKFAVNCMIAFKTPENFFCSEVDVIPPVQYPAVRECKPMDELIVNFVAKSKEMVIMVGLSGSGKSTVAKNLEKRFGYKLINQDTLGTAKKCLESTVQALINNLCVIIDATNPDVASRKKYIDIARRYNYIVRCIQMIADFNLAKHNNYLRFFRTGIPVVPDVAYRIYLKKFKQPKTSEGFVEIINVVPGRKHDILNLMYLY
jgi:bifunctional polynucleotide phosphatase/kinase